MSEISIKKLARLRRDMQAAFDASEWQRLADLDKTCQQLVRQVIEDDPRAMFDELRDMLGFYQGLVTNCETQRHAYAKEVADLRRGRKQNRTYSQMQKLSAAI